MMPQNLNALFPTSGSKAGVGSLSGSDMAAPGAEKWGDILARFESMAQPNPHLLASTEEFQALSAQRGDGSARGDLVGHFGALFEMLETQGAGQSASAVLPSSKVPGESTEFGQPLYDQSYWPATGEMVLLLQGINPWGGDLQPEQTQWLEQVGPYLGVPELSQSYAGPTDLGRDFTVVNLAEAAGADPQRAFVDAWLGRHSPEISRNSYESRWELNPASGALLADIGQDWSPGQALKMAESLAMGLQDQSTLDLSQYEGEYWPATGEMILLLQGINPWGEDLQPEQTQWLAQVGPYLGVPELTQSYAGPTELGRDFTVVNLAVTAGADPQRAFVDAWLGRHKPEIAQNLYQSRWDWNQSRGSAAVSPLPEPTLPGVRLSDMLEMAREADLGIKSSMPELNRSVLFSQMSAAQSAVALDFREASAQSSRADVSMTQLNPSALARDPALPPTTLLSGQPQSSAAELRAAAEQAMERVVWLAARKQGVSQARLQLHPAHLGKLDIRLEVQGREASLHMSVHNAPVREAVEAMLPRLREQLEQQGLNLGDAWVFDSGPEDAPERERAMLAEAGSIGAEDDLDQSGDSQDLPRRGVGLLDEFA